MLWFERKFNRVIKYKSFLDFGTNISKNIFLIDMTSMTTIFENYYVFQCFKISNFLYIGFFLFHKFLSNVYTKCLRLVDCSYISKLLSCLDKSTTLRVKTKNDVRTFKRVEFFHSKELSNYWLLCVKSVFWYILLKNETKFVRLDCRHLPTKAYVSFVCLKKSKIALSWWKIIYFDV